MIFVVVRYAYIISRCLIMFNNFYLMCFFSSLNQGATKSFESATNVIASIASTSKRIRVTEIFYKL